VANDCSDVGVIGVRRHGGDECRRLNNPGSTMPRAKTARGDVKTSFNSVYDEIETSIGAEKRAGGKIAAPGQRQRGGQT